MKARLVLHEKQKYRLFCTHRLCFKFRSSSNPKEAALGNHSMPLTQILLI